MALASTLALWHIEKPITQDPHPHLLLSTPVLTVVYCSPRLWHWPVTGQPSMVVRSHSAAPSVGRVLATAPTCGATSVVMVGNGHTAAVSVAKALVKAQGWSSTSEFILVRSPSAAQTVAVDSAIAPTWHNITEVTLETGPSAVSTVVVALPVVLTCCGTVPHMVGRMEMRSVGLEGSLC